MTQEEGDTNNEGLIEKTDLSKIPRDGLTFRHISAYSVGHFNNDLCAAQWFVYLSWYINKVVELSPTLTGLCLLSG